MIGQQDGRDSVALNNTGKPAMISVDTKKTKGIS
jgi:hypothetical protein